MLECWGKEGEESSGGDVLVEQGQISMKFPILVLGVSQIIYWK